MRGLGALLTEAVAGGGHATVRVHFEGRGLAVQIEDDSGGIPTDLPAAGAEAAVGELEAAGAELRVVNTPGRGRTFTVWLASA